MEARERVKEIIRSARGAGCWSMAADVISSEFIMIPREDLPESSLDKGACIEVSGVDHSVWPINQATADRAFRDALEYLAAATAIKQHMEQRAESRRDELARELSADTEYAYSYAEAPLQAAIDRIIELEGSA